MKPLAALLFITWGFIAVAWYFPQLLKSIACMLYSIAEASEHLKSRYQKNRKTGPPQPDKINASITEIPSATHQDVIKALTAQGASRKKAEAAADAARASLPADATFEQLFRTAVKLAA